MYAHKLKAGDRVRITKLPPAWSLPDWHVPKDTIAVYQALIGRQRPIRIREVDRYGQYWFTCVLYRKQRREVHSMTLDDACWVQVKKRNK